jgi:hypothetical protein
LSDLFGFPQGLRMFFLGHVSEPSTHDLRLVLIEADAKGLVNEVADDFDAQGQEVSPLDPAEAWVLNWKNYISYAVRNESYALENNAPKVENMLIEREASAFRDFVSNAAWATDKYPGKLRHFEIVCEHHIIDVISTDPPIVSRETVDPGSLIRRTIQVIKLT